MRKYLLTGLFSLFVLKGSLGQGLRQLIQYEANTDIDYMYHTSDSTFYGYSYGHKKYYLFKDKKWKPLDLTEGRLFTAPNSKIYFLDKTSLSIINPITHKKEKSYGLKRNSVPDHFSVFKDSFFIAYSNYSDTAVYMYNFNDKAITKQTLLIKVKNDYRGAELVDDTILYYAAGSSLYRKNLKSGIVSKLLIYSPLNYFKAYKNNLVIINNKNHFFISENYGSTFRDIDLSNYFGLQTNTLHLTQNKIYFLAYPYRLITLDFYGNELHSNELENRLWFYYTSPACNHAITEVNQLIWFNDSSWLIPSYDGDVYKVFPWKNSLKYLGGSFNLGVNRAYINNKGNQFFFETANGFWSFSSDTGKSWQIPEMVIKRKAKRAEFIDSQVIILHNNKLNLYSFGFNRIDTTLYSLKLKINDFGVMNTKSLILFTTSGNYLLNRNTANLSLLGPPSPFEDFVYLKKTKRLLAITNVGIFNSDNYGKSWKQSGLISHEIFASLAVENSFQAIEISSDTVHLKPIFNGLPTLLRSFNSGRTFYLHKNSFTSESIASAELYNDQYFLLKDNRIIRSMINSEMEVIDQYSDDCPASGMQSFDSGIFIWNSRAEIFYKKINYQKVYPSVDKIRMFPNPVNSNSSLSIIIPSDIIGRVNTVEIYDVIGRKQPAVILRYSEDSNLIELHNLPARVPGFYIVYVEISDAVPYRQKIMIY